MGNTANLYTVQEIFNNCYDPATNNLGATIVGTAAVGNVEVTGNLLVDGTTTLTGATTAAAIGCGAITSTGALVVAGNITDYKAVNDANPVIRLGSSANENFAIRTNYDTGAQTVSEVEIFLTNGGVAQDIASIGIVPAAVSGLAYDLTRIDLGNNSQGSYIGLAQDQEDDVAAKVSIVAHGNAGAVTSGDGLAGANVYYLGSNGSDGFDDSLGGVTDGGAGGNKYIAAGYGGAGVNAGDDGTNGKLYLGYIPTIGSVITTYATDVDVRNGALTVSSAAVTTTVDLFINTIKSGATQIAAGAANHEVWKTNGHATLPNNVLMIGV